MPAPECTCDYWGGGAVLCPLHENAAALYNALEAFTEVGKATNYHYLRHRENLTQAREILARAPGEKAA